MKNILSYLGLVGFLVWFVQTQKLFDKIKIPIFQEIRSCKLCLGTWIGMFLYPSMKVRTINSFLDMPITSAIISFLWYIIEAGWQRLFGVTHIK